MKKKHLGLISLICVACIILLIICADIFLVWDMSRFGWHG